MIAALVAINAAVFVAWSFGGATAHTTATFYPAKWNPNADVHYNIDNDVPINMRDSLNAGLGNWDDLAGGNGPHFINDEPTAGGNDLDPCTGPSKMYVREDLGAWVGAASESVLGLTQWCRAGPATGTQRVTKIQITYELTARANGAIGWNKDASEPGSNQWDLRSTATHEAGHATGFYGHFTDAATCPLNSTRATMCEGNVGLIGTSWRRSREPHDNHTFSGAY